MTKILQPREEKICDLTRKQESALIFVSGKTNFRVLNQIVNLTSEHQQTEHSFPDHRY